LPNPTVRQIASRRNLALAWARIRTAGDISYKNHFRHIYQSFALVADESLEDIRSRLLAGIYEPSTATKFFLPKSSGGLRPITLLGIEDQIVYQAFGNVIADRLLSRVGSRYNRTVFGNLYAGKTSIFFFADWRRSYGLYTNAMRRAVRQGYKWSASFDLTACYDSIDHTVLRYFLRQLGIDPESCASLCALLSHWTEASGRQKPLYHGHGIPQGPGTSGILAEAVLRHFDDVSRPKGVKYFRYVDDIRAFATNPDALRRELFRLDLRSKEVGLFPQAAKTEIHRVKNIDDEIKSLSSPSEVGTFGRVASQGTVRRRLAVLSPRLRILNPTRFKFVLAQATPHTPLALRLLSIVRLQPSSYEPIFRHLGKYRQLSPKVSEEVLDLLRGFQLYPSFTAALIRTIEPNIHPTKRLFLHRFCRSRLGNTKRDWNPELRAAAAGCLIRDGAATWPQTDFNTRWTKNWWVRSQLIRAVNVAHFGIPSVESLANILLRDEVFDVAIVASDMVLANGLAVKKPLKTIHPGAESALRTAGIIGRVATNTCFVNKAVVDVLGPQLRPIQWRKVFSKRGVYRAMLSRFSHWRAYSTLDPTAWVALTDTINDVILESLFRHDGHIGVYQLGSIGSVLASPTSRFATAYPRVCTALRRFHTLRLEADLSHSITRSTNQPTRRIRFAELRPLKPLLGAAYVEMWTAW
jgi:hypothetical protein